MGGKVAKSALAESGRAAPVHYTVSRRCCEKSAVTSVRVVAFSVKFIGRRLLILREVKVRRLVAVVVSRNLLWM